MQLSGADIRLMRVFDAVVRHRGFAAAQAELNVSQSTISTQITALEDRLGMTLCRRGRAGFRLTQKGEAVHAAVVRFLAASEEFTSETAALRGALSGTLRIGVVDNVVTDPNFRLPEAISALEKRATSLRIELAQCSPQDLQARVRDGSLHLGIGSFPHKVAGLNYKPLYTETNYLYWRVQPPALESPQRQAHARVRHDHAHGPAQLLARRSLEQPRFPELTCDGTGVGATADNDPIRLLHRLSARSFGDTLGCHRPPQSDFERPFYLSLHV